MLGLYATASVLGENGHDTAFRTATLGDTDYTPHDLTVKVTALPSHGTVLKEGGTPPVILGQMVSTGELAALTFKPATAQTGYATGPTIKPRLESWLVVSVSQNGKPGPLGIQASRISIESHVVVTELPSNGMVFLADRTTAVAQEQTPSIAQLNGLMFTPAGDPTGKITILQYRAVGPLKTAAIGGVLRVVVSDAPPMSTPTMVTGTDGNIVGRTQVFSQPIASIQQVTMLMSSLKLAA